MVIEILPERFYHSRNTFQLSMTSSRESQKGQGPTPHFQNNKNMNVLTNAQSRFASVLGPPHLARHTWIWPCPCSFGSNALGELRALEGHLVSSKKPFKRQSRRTQGRVAGRNRRVFDEGSLICQQGRSTIFYLSDPFNTWLLATPLLSSYNAWTFMSKWARFEISSLSKLCLTGGFS